VRIRAAANPANEEPGSRSKRAHLGLGALDGSITKPTWLSKPTSPITITDTVGVSHLGLFRFRRKADHNAATAKRPTLRRCSCATCRVYVEARYDLRSHSKVLSRPDLHDPKRCARLLECYLSQEQARNLSSKYEQREHQSSQKRHWNLTLNLIRPSLGSASTTAETELWSYRAIPLSDSPPADIIQHIVEGYRLSQDGILPYLKGKQLNASIL